MRAVEPASASWLAVKAHCLAEIEAARARLEAFGMSAEAAEAERGRIAALRGVLRMEASMPDAPMPLTY
jgi:hypothetical protein